jgi:hypothetical protein
VSRAVVALDRLLALILGTALFALGLGAIAWQTDSLSWAQPRLTAAWLVTATEQRWWWPWVTGAGGVVLVVLGLWWLTAHVPRRRLGEIRLPGSGAEGILRVNTDAVALAAGESLGAADCVRSASGRAMVDRGRPTIVITATVDPLADLTLLGAAATQVQAEIARALDGVEMATRIHLHVASS